MKYVKLGNSDLSVSRICLGCMGFGDPQNGQHSWTVGREKTEEIVKHAVEQGINFFDTALVYQNGTSEQYLGQALKNTCRGIKPLLQPSFCLELLRK